MKPCYRSSVILNLLILICVNFLHSQTINQNNPLYEDPATKDFSKNPALLDRIVSSPHGYFRHINIRFSNEVCQRFSQLLIGAPSLNLHGDAHLEQYAVTDLGRGLTDYDDSSTGPAIIDWMRFGVSLHLTCRERDWDNQAEELFEQFLNGYRNALNDPEINAPQPTIVKRIQSTFKHNREAYFEWVTSLMEPMSSSEKDSLLIAIRPYVQTQFAEKPDLNRNYFDLVNMGYLKMGIGSALDLKYLVRVQGKTEDPLDDVVLEFKEVRDLSGIDCISIGQKIDPFRILLGQSRIAYHPFHHLGYFYFRGLNFWVHSWVDNYKEVNIGETFQSFEELVEVAYDVGVQLGLGHVKHIAAPLDLQVRLKQMEILDHCEMKIKKACKEFTDLTVAAWKKFCRSAELKTMN